MYAADHAAANPDKPAIIMAGSGAVQTFGEYEANANRLAHYFRSLGLHKGDHIAILMENHLRYFEVMAAAERTGLYFTCVSSHLTPPEAGYIVDDCEALVFISSGALLDVAEAAVEHAPRVRVCLALDLTEPTARFEPLDEAVSGQPTSPIDDEQLGAAMLYSSGTTGRPKGILRPLPDARPSDQLEIMTFAVQLLRMSPDMVYLSPAPTYHAAPQASVSTALRLGATSVIMESFDAERFLALVEQYAITNTNMVPTMFSRILKLDPHVRTKHDLSSLRTIAHTAAPCPLQVKQAMIEWLGPILVEYYGSTEANGYAWCDSEEWLAHPGTVGRAVWGTIRILDDDGNDLPLGVPGRIWFEGATNFQYFHDKDTTTEGRDSAGKRSTVGDVGYLDRDGYLYLTDRATFMIISGGVNIYPQETENLLIPHAAVYDAAVFGVPNDDLGEEVKAVVQLAPGVEPGAETEQMLIDYCRANIAHFKCPRSIDFIAEMPRLPTGKLYKRLLRDRYWGDSESRIVKSTSP